MSKRALKKYLSELSKPGLEEQVLDLYERFPAVKKYYNFTFNPKEDQMIAEAKAKIANEYFPVRRKRPRARRSTAQKYIKNFRTLHMQEGLVADLMWYNLETAQKFSARRNVPDAFYKSMLNSFKEAVQFTILNALVPEYRERMERVYKEIHRQNWLWIEDFDRVWDDVSQEFNDNVNQEFKDNVNQEFNSWLTLSTNVTSSSAESIPA